MRSGVDSLVYISLWADPRVQGDYAKPLATFISLFPPQLTECKDWELPYFPCFVLAAVSGEKMWLGRCAVT